MFYFYPVVRVVGRLLKELGRQVTLTIYTDATIRTNTGIAGYLIPAERHGKVVTIPIGEPVHGEVGTIDYLEAVALRDAVFSLDARKEYLKGNTVVIQSDNRPALYFISKYVGEIPNVFIEGSPYWGFDEEKFLSQMREIVGDQYEKVIRETAEKLKELSKEGFPIFLFYVHSSRNLAHSFLQRHAQRFE